MKSWPFDPSPLPESNLAAEKKAARFCAICREKLPLGPRPVLRGEATARILIVGQAPGVKVHATGIPWNDPSGDRLRQWMNLSRELFYDEGRIAILPMGLCYPGRYPRGGDLPPVPECAPRWHPRIVPFWREIELVLLIGQYAQAYYLGEDRAASLTETVRRWREFMPRMLPLPHPSFRNNAWLQRNVWFTEEVIPYLRERVDALL